VLSRLVLFRCALAYRKPWGEGGGASHGLHAPSHLPSFLHLSFVCCLGAMYTPQKISFSDVCKDSSLSSSDIAKATLRCPCLRAQFFGIGGESVDVLYPSRYQSVILQASSTCVLTCNKCSYPDVLPH